MNSRFLLEQMLVDTGRNYFSSHARGSSGSMVKIDRGILEAFPILAPDGAAEQAAIAQALTDTQDLIESLEQLLAKKRQIKQGAMQELLTGQRRLPGFAGDWVFKPLGRLGRWCGGMTPSMRKTDYWQPGVIPWMSSGDVKVTRLLTTAMSISNLAVRANAATVVPAHSVVLVSRSGILRRHLPVALNLVPMAINQDIKALIPASDVSPEFVLQALLHQGSAVLGSCLKSGTTVESIHFPWFKDFMIAIPLARKEQAAIAQTLSDMDAELTALEARIAKARALKQGMAQALLTGRIRLV